MDRKLDPPPDTKMARRGFLSVACSAGGLMSTAEQWSAPALENLTRTAGAKRLLREKYRVLIFSGCVKRATRDLKCNGDRRLTQLQGRACFELKRSTRIPHIQSLVSSKLNEISITSQERVSAFAQCGRW